MLSVCFRSIGLQTPDKAQLVKSNHLSRMTKVIGLVGLIALTAFVCYSVIGSSPIPIEHGYSAMKDNIIRQHKNFDNLKFGSSGSNFDGGKIGNSKGCSGRDISMVHYDLTHLLPLKDESFENAIKSVFQDIDGVKDKHLNKAFAYELRSKYQRGSDTTPVMEGTPEYSHFELIMMRC
jgi:hypothetical protein